MEEREAIAKLKETTDYRYSHYAYVNDTGKAFDMAIKALEKQGLEKRKLEKSMRIEVKKLIEEHPTVYDVDKVVEQLENERKFWENAYDSNLGKEKARSYEHAIEIVKGGGVDVN
ncbi:MAG TPA: hypothetical protein DCX86_02380 [Coprococcus sp.]|jgi:arginyl-tRNA synthetase|nr:hypothetical protein [Coprococcus sp.]